MGIRRPEGQHTQQHHLEAAARVRRQRQIAAPYQAHLIIELHVLAGQNPRQLKHPLTITLAVIHRFGQRLGNGYTVQHIEHLGQYAIPVRPLLRQMPNSLN